MRAVRRFALLALVSIASCQSVATAPSMLAQDVAQARAASPAPALGAVVVSCSSGIDVAQDGVTRIDMPEPLSANARFNIGSNAKSMLATLAGTFVRDGVLGWDTTVEDIFADEAETFDPVMRRVTLGQLLSHRSGAAAYASGAELSAVQVSGDTPSAQRLAFALRVLRAPPVQPPGSGFLYSNAGYVIAGVMLERVGGAPFETLMRERLFAPLQMTSATFGASTQAGRPIGHYTQDGAQAVYLDADPAIPAFLQPAGDVSLTLEDYGRYLREHLCGLEGRATRVLPAVMIQFLHAPQGEDGASFGWGRYAFGETPASIHVGGTGTFSAFVAVLPSRDLAVGTVTNSGFGDSRQAALGLLQSIIERQTRTSTP